MRLWTSAIKAGLLIAASQAIAVTGCVIPAGLPDGWPVAAPGQNGLDAALLCAIGPRFEEWKAANAHAVVVARHGALIYEHYQWWLGRPLVERREIDWAAGSGWGGQRLYVVPAEGLVVAVYAGAYGRPQIVGPTVPNRYVLPAVAR
jgi:CubicO group peptidase (beta-lactamase class C family)